MEKYILSSDISVFCVTAKSFPDGVLQAHQELHSLVPFSNDRRYFGISRPYKDTIVYKAAAEEMHQGEAKKLGCEPFTIKNGHYISIVIADFMKDTPSIGRAFQKLLSHLDIDPNGFCIEWYLNDQDLRCMVRLDPAKLI